MVMAKHAVRRLLAGLALAAGAGLLGACGGGVGGSNASTAAAAQATPPLPAPPASPAGYVQGYSMARVGWYSYDAGHTTTPLIANVQTALSDTGEVAGYYTIEACANCAYSEATNGTPTYSAVDDYCMGHDGRMACSSQDTARNAAGTTAGVELMGFPAYDPYSAAPVYHAFAGASDLGTLGGSNSYATGINAAAQVVGYSDLPGNTAVQAFFFDQGTMTRLAMPGSGSGRATAINAGGQVSGYATPAGSAVSHGFYYSGGIFTDLGEGQAAALNASGQVAGSNGAGAYLTGPGGGARLALGAGSAVGVNAAGQVVINGAGTYIWDGAAQVDLNAIIAPGDPLAGLVTLTEAIAINGSGQILVNGHDRNGWQLQFLLSPPPLASQLATLGRIAQQAGAGKPLATLVAQAQSGSTGNPAGTCGALSAAHDEIATEAGHELAVGTARQLAVDVHVMMSTTGCAY